jgi:hypothetical protein
MNAHQISWRKISSTLAVTLVAGIASAQTTCPLPDNCFTNPGFETANPFNAAEPQGWHNLSNPNEAQRRVLGDSLLPAAVARTGQASIMLATPGFSDFRGFTTDTTNFFQTGFPFYDPAYDWQTLPDVRVSGWYYIPTSDPITGDSAGIKLEVKALNQPFATLDPWAGEAPTIQGDTGNEWVYYEIVWTGADIFTEVEDNGTLGIIPYPANTPNRVKAVIGRFGFDNLPSSGVIFWDDLKIEYIAGGPSCPPCAADYDNNGGVDGGDLGAFFADFEAGETCADVDGNGGVDGGDLGFFFAVFEAGGC